MPIQIIINAIDPKDAMIQMATFIGMRGLQDVPAIPLEENRQAEVEVNGAAAEVEVEVEKPKRTRARKAAPPEPEPEVEEEPEDEQLQDDADEQEEEPTGASADDVRAAINNIYVKKYGMASAQADILKLYKMRFPDGSVEQVSDIPEGMHQQVIDDIAEMAGKNPFKRKPS